MIQLSEIAKKLREAPNIIVVAAGAGVHYQTLYKIARGQGDVNYSTYEKLVKYFEKEERAKNEKTESPS
jgi:predicted transcriptional regulator